MAEWSNSDGFYIMCLGKTEQTQVRICDRTIPLNAATLSPRTECTQRLVSLHFPTTKLKRTQREQLKLTLNARPGVCVCVDAAEFK